MLPVVVTASRARLAPLLMVAATSSFAARALAAEEATRSARLEVESGSACATRSELVARVRTRLPRVSFVDVGGAIVISTRFTSELDGAIVAEVLFTGAAAKASTRRVVTRSCSEATDAAALIIAMTLRPTAVGSLDASADSATADAASSSQGAAPTSPTAVEQQPKKNEQPDQADASAGAPVSGSKSATSFGVLVAAQSFVGPAPEVMRGVALYATVGLDRAALWAPAVLVGATHAWQSAAQERGGRASFTLDAASFDACPVRLQLGRVRARPCAAVLIGRFAASGADTSNAAESQRPFWVVGGAAIASADLFWLFEASARVAIGANLVRDSFEFTPTVFHTVPAFTLAASAGVGLRWR